MQYGKFGAMEFLNMTFMHFDATTAAAAPSAIVQLLDANASDSSYPSVYAELTAYSNGQVWNREGNFDSFLFNWFDPQESLPGVIPYEMRRTNTIGDEPSGPNDDVWTSLVGILNSTLMVVTNGGSAYTLNDILTVDGGAWGTGGSAATVQVTGESGGQVTELTRVDTGAYSTTPPKTGNTTTGGTGTGVIFSTSWANGITWALGATYPGDNYTTFTVEIRKGSGPVLDTAIWDIQADAS